MRLKQIIVRFLFTALFTTLVAAVGHAATSDVADAVMNGNTQAVRALLAKKADVNAAQADGTTAVHWAVRHDDLEMLDQLVRAGASVTTANRLGATPLYLACVNGNAAIIGRLIKNGADVNGTVLQHGETPLMFAARSGNVGAVKLLLEGGAQVDARETLRETTAVVWAAEQNHAEIVKLLAGHDADLNGQSTIAEAKKRRGVVYAQGENLHTGGITPLVVAAREGALEAVKALVEAKADLNKPSGDRSTALLVAVQNGHYDVAHYLVDRGADINAVNEKGWTPLYLAVKHRNIETGTIPVPNQNRAKDFIAALLDRGVDVNARIKANTEIRNGQRATWLNEAGATAFLRAALCGDIEVMKLLLAKGADPKIATDDHTTPLMAAAGVGYSDGFIHDRSIPETIEAMKLLLDLGAEVNAANDQGLTALHGAAHKAALEEIQLLVDRGANLAAVDKGSKAYGANTPGLTPLDWAQGVVVGVQSAIYHADAVELITKLMQERGLPMPKGSNRTLGGNAVVSKGQ